MTLKTIIDQLTFPPYRIYTAYDLSLLIFRAQTREDKRLPTLTKIRKIVETLISDGILTEKKYAGGNVFLVAGTKAPEPIDQICAIDIFCYISHWSAMCWHHLEGVGVSDALYISNPEPKLWRRCATQKIIHDFKEHVETFYERGFLRPVKISPTRLGKWQIVNTYTSQYDAAWIYDGDRRVATIGRTFLDMVRCPSRCGGINLVIDIYQQNAHRFLTDIVNELNVAGNKIEKVRAGYLLDEVCGIKDYRIDAWLKEVQRGGSRKLDPNADYKSMFSEKWCLSINNPRLSLGSG